MEQTTYQGLIHRYRAYLPVNEKTPVVSLWEGNTPLIPLLHFPKSLPVHLNMWVKFEGLNPTGSFKDRGMTMAISKAKEAGHQAVICASTGNTSASAAAYAARAGMKCFVLIPEGKIALGKLSQALIHGAEVIQIEGNFDEGMALVKTLAADTPIEIVNSINPFRPAGQKTAAFEIVDTLGDAPHYHCLPVGNAANIAAYWQGYTDYFQAKQSTRIPHMVGYQAQGAAPMVKQQFIDCPETLATAIRIGHPQSFEKANAAQRASNGWFMALSDQEILQAQSLLASMEGIFAEPASACAVAGVMKDARAGRFETGANIVITLTGHGLKDPEIALSEHRDKLKVVPAEFKSIQSLIVSRLDVA